MNSTNSRIKSAITSLVASFFIGIIPILIAILIPYSNYYSNKPIYPFLIVGIVAIYLGICLAFGYLAIAIAEKKNSDVRSSYFMAISFLLTPLTSLLFSGFLPCEIPNRERTKIEKSAPNSQTYTDDEGYVESLNSKWKL